MMKPHSSHLLTFSLVAIWIAVFYMIFYSPPPPITSLGKDLVAPTKVIAGGQFTVYRNLRSVSAQPVRVVRQMIKGDCKRSCEIIDLPTSWLSLEPGEYFNVQRDHEAPLAANPGVWRIVFHIQYEDRVGRMRSEPLEELQIEVTQQ